MKTSSKCIACFFRQIEKTASLLETSKKSKEKMFFLLTKKLIKFDFNQPPVVFGRTIYKTTSRIAGTKDPFFKEKIKIENHLLKISPYLEKIIRKAKNPLRVAAKMCCAANSIDFGAGFAPNLAKLITELKNIKLKIDHFDKFLRKLKKAKLILFVADNCGEALFDRFFIEEIRRFSPAAEIFYATRSSPIINDVLISDAKKLGIEKSAKIISSGCDYPGLILSKTSKHFLKIYRKSSLVISKGQGNFESFLDRKKDIFYLFKIKCPTVSKYLSLGEGKLLFFYNKFMI